MQHRSDEHATKFPTDATTYYDKNDATSRKPTTIGKKFLYNKFGIQLQQKKSCATNPQPNCNKILFLQHLRRYVTTK